MTDHTQRTCCRRGKRRFNVGFLCCALLTSLFVTTNLVGAAPITRVGLPGEVSNAPTHKWLIGTIEVGLAPPKDSTEMQEVEWNVGVVVGLAKEACGIYGKANKVYAFMKKSSYFKKGYTDVVNFGPWVIRGCGSHDSNLQKILGQKEEWENYLGATYPDGATVPEPSKNQSVEEKLSVQKNQR